MSYLEKLLPEFRKGAKIRKNYWNKCQYIYYKDNNIYTHKNMCINLTANELVTDYWELYHGSEPDWQYIIDHKCLCWFWNNHHSADDEEIGFLHFVDERIEKKFNTLYKYCRPVRRDEVTFYEDTESTHPSIGSLYKGGIYIGEYNGKEVVMMLNDEKEEMIWDEAMNLEHCRPPSILEWQLYKENKEVIDEALEKYGEPLQGDEWYWSSSEFNNYNAWYVRPSDGNMNYYGNKHNNNRVRCVLAF